MIRREAVLHKVVTKPLGYLNYLTSSTELKKITQKNNNNKKSLEAGIWKTVGWCMSNDYRDSFPGLSPEHCA